MKDYFTSSSSLVKKRNMYGGESKWGGVQGSDPYFTTNITGSPATHQGSEYCYAKVNNIDFHPKWGNEYCHHSHNQHRSHQHGGQKMSREEYQAYKAYKKYKQKYKQLVGQ